MKGIISMKCASKIMRLYAVTDRAWLNGETLYEQVEKALKGGVTCVQIREKEMSHEDFLKEAVEINELCKKYSVPLIINDDVQAAVECGADGIHVGQEDMKVEDVRKIVGDNMIIGVSVINAEQAKKAVEGGADYLGAGAVFPTSTKLDADYMTSRELKEVCALSDVPVVAIGGINKNNITELKGSGIDGVALVSAIFASKDITNACRELLALSEQTVKTKIAGAVFDMDGTLLDSMPMWDNIGTDLVKLKGCTPIPGLRQSIRSMSLYQAACFIKENHPIGDSVPEIMDGINKLTEDYYFNKAAAKENVREFLTHLKDGGVKMCVATATDKYLAEAALKKAGLSDFFEKIFTCTEIGHGKDKPDIFNRALEYLAVDKDKLMIFEDASHAAETAKKAGFKVCGVYDSAETDFDKLLDNSDIYIKSFKKAGDYID